VEVELGALGESIWGFLPRSRPISHKAGIKHYLSCEVDVKRFNAAQKGIWVVRGTPDSIAIYLDRSG
jgi:hypothetical protein